jgi:hypothetical protein
MWTAQLADEAGGSHITVLHFLKDILAIYKTALCWVLHHLSKEQKWHHYVVAALNLEYKQ